MAESGTTARNLDSLAPELNHHIVPRLDFESKCCLRLVNRQLAAILSASHEFQAHFTSRTVTLDDAGLTDFESMTQRR
jgi:hypothetical protein